MEEDRPRSLFHVGVKERILVKDEVELLWLHRTTHLFDARFVGVQQRSGFHVFWDQFAADLWDFLPVLQHGESQMFIRLSLQT